MKRILDICLGFLATLQWIFTREPEHSLIEPPAGVPEVGCVYYEDVRK